jgi:hypothetical protein
VEDLTRAAALTYTAITGGAVAFQLGLALGAPWGSYAMGGRFAGVFPRIWVPVALALLATSLGVAL